MAPLEPRVRRQVKQQRHSAPALDVHTYQFVSLIASPGPRLERERHPLLSISDYYDLVARCQQLEKRVFPKAEAMDLREELRKPNQYLFAVLQGNEPALVIAYGVLALSKVDYIARITKVCTDPQHRGLGAGEHLVRSMLAALGDPLALLSAQHISEPKGFTSICGIGSLRMNAKGVQLHVDTQRDVAIRMYTRCGFSTKTTIPDYYGGGRNAFLMNRGIASTAT